MNQNIDPAEGYDKALALLHDCATADGFVASPSERDNYQRVWGRDGTIISLDALLTGDDRLIKTARKTFETLEEYQGPPRPKTHPRRHPAPRLERCRSDHRPACAGRTTHFQD